MKVFSGQSFQSSSNFQEGDVGRKRVPSSCSGRGATLNLSNCAPCLGENSHVNSPIFEVVEGVRFS